MAAATNKRRAAMRLGLLPEDEEGSEERTVERKPGVSSVDEGWGGPWPSRVPGVLTARPWGGPGMAMIPITCTKTPFCAPRRRCSAASGAALWAVGAARPRLRLRLRPRLRPLARRPPSSAAARP